MVYMKELRVLFTGVGRRIELIQSFREAALYLGISLKIYGADMTGTAPALAYCDYTRKVCGMREENYISEADINKVMATMNVKPESSKKPTKKAKK